MPKAQRHGSCQCENSNTCPIPGWQPSQAHSSLTPAAGPVCLTRRMLGAASIPSYLPGTRDARPAPSHSSERGPPHAAQSEASSRRTLRERWLRQGIAGDEQKERREGARGEWTEQRRVRAANYSMLRVVSSMCSMCSEHGVKVCTVGGVRGILWGLESGGGMCFAESVKHSGQSQSRTGGLSWSG
ncbi:hypothetical protein OIDMADRAFT_26327 [Oidiodendron maius Zn]|uniref:Uncharacterized protein n=1 Tax=Oidiodendron maius (strain Zn) TaxID=913774 RepID=A0A0C3DNP4_OIDMZ|nr:hypothetical protein OIDMADRAFT_26327 [Oidiodendron maius Zn]